MFVLDNHRPVHLKNIQSQESVTVFVEEFETYDNAPIEFEADDLLTDDEESEGEDVDDGESEEEDDEDDDFDIADEGNEEEEEEEEAFVDDDGQRAEEVDGEEEKGGDGDEEGVDTKAEDDVDGGAAKDEDVVVDEEKGFDEDPKIARGDDPSHLEGAAEGDGEEDPANDGDTSREVDDNPAQENEDSDDEENLRVNKKRKIERDEGAERREQVMNYKNIRASYCKPTSWLLLKLVSDQGNMLDTIWQAILGVTDQHERQRLDEEEYLKICDDLHLRLANYLSNKGERKYTVEIQGDSVVVPGAQTGHIEEGQDYRFFLYRHWSLFDSMCYSSYVSAKMKTWKGLGIYKLQELLAKMGVSLEECKQMYSFMAPESKQHFNNKIKEADIKANYFLANPDVTCRSFYRYNSFKNPIAARDVIHAANALVEIHSTYHNEESERESSRLKAFNDAYDCLGMHSDSMLKKGLQSAINLQKMIVKKAGAVLEDDLQILKLKYLYYIPPPSTRATGQAPGIKSNQVVSDEDEIDPPFCRPMVLVKLGNYIMDIKMNMDKRREQGWKGKKLLPLILAGEEQKNGKCFVVGIDPRLSILSIEAKEDADLEVLDNLCNFKSMFKAAAKGLGIIYPSNGASKYPALFSALTICFI